jgi:N-acetylglutamate synthase-like GNAT family acetyltransferase
MITIRTATRTDIAAIDALLARSYPRLLAPDYLPSVLVTAIPVMARAQPGLVTSGTYYVADDDGMIVGAGGWTAAIPGKTTRQPGRGNVRHVVTDDRRVREGIGRVLMDHVFDEARAAGMNWMHCMATITAVPFYKAMGFTVIGPMTVSLGQAGIAFPAMEMRRDLQAPGSL